MTDHYYPDIQGWFTWPQLYRDAVASTPDGGNIVEIGVWRGKSLSFLLVEAANSGKALNIYGVDHFKGSVGEPDLLREAERSDLYAECRANCDQARYPYKLLAMPSVKAAEMFKGESVDFVFVDASHNYESVKADLRSWLPKMKAGGIIAGHDICAPGVAQAVTELLPEADVFRDDGCWVYTIGTFTCDKCGGTFAKSTPDVDAMAECESHFGRQDDVSTLAVVCDECWKAIHPQRN